MMLCKYPWLQHYQIKDRLQNSAYRIDVSQCDWDPYDFDCWEEDHPCWCDRAGSGRIDAVFCLSKFFYNRCPPPQFSRGVTLPWQAALPMMKGNANHGEVAVYDLLGRRLCSFPLPERPWNRASLVSYIKLQAQLPMGAKMIRLRTEEEVHTWRLAP